VLALLFGLFAAVQSGRAADKAGQALDRLDRLAAPTAPPAAAVPPPANTPAGEEPSTDPATAEPDPNGTGTTPELNAQTQYKQRYANQALRVAADCNAGIHIDLDEPRVKVDQALGEFSYYDPCGAPAGYLNLGSAIEGSLVSSSAVTPIECAEQIRTSPVSSENQPVRRGQVYCIKTSLDAARASAGTWKMVVLEVTATAQDGTVTFKASAWDIPG